MGYLKYFIFNYGFLVAFLLVAILLIIIGIKAKKSVIKHILFNTSAIFIAICLYEGYLLMTVEKKAFSYFEGSFTHTPEYWNGNGVRWFGPANEEFVISVRKIYDFNHELYDVQYTVKDGIRNTPGSVDTSKSFALFLGCSFTFGEGLEDNQTVPYYFNHYSGTKYLVRNYGFHGYGPHHALFITENEILKDTVLLKGKSESIVFYSLLPDHYGRAAGYKNWDKYGPKYVIEGDSLLFKGKFHEKYGKLKENLYKVWEGTQLFKRHFSHKEIKEEDVLRVVMMLARMRDDYQQIGVPFYVVLDYDSCNGKYSDYLISLLTKYNLSYFKVSDMIPDIKSGSSRYFMENDGHPVALYNELVGKYLAEKISNLKSKN